MPLPRLLMVSTHGYLAAKPHLGRPDTGGQVVYVLELSKALAAHGFDVDILTRRFEHQEATEEVADRVRILRVAYAGREFRPKEVLSHFVPELLNEYFQRSQQPWREYELVSSHYWDAGVAGMGLARKMGIPHLHTPHSLGLSKRQNRAWGSAGENVTDRLDDRIRNERAIYHHADLVVTTAAEQTRCLQECDEYNVPEQKVVQIPAGVDDTLFYQRSAESRLALKRKLGWTNPSVFCAGRISPSKGYDLMIRAFPAVLRRVPDAQLILAIGAKSPSAEEEQLVGEWKSLAENLGIAPFVQFLPCVDQRRLAECYHAADVFVLCSRNEPFGMTAIESMACGTPTVMTIHGGLWEEMAWGQDCIYCDPLDCDALSQAVCSPLLQPRIRAQLSSAGAATVASRYTWTKVAQKMIQCCVDRGWLQASVDGKLAIP